MEKILCLDPGTAHTGIAISEEGILASPLATIFERNIDKLVGRIIPYLGQFNPDKVIIGMPEYGPIKSFSKDLGERLAKVYSGEIIFFEENLSSNTARIKMKEAKKTLADRKKEEHQTAAALILQDYLESL